ncbi:DMT family transporter [Scytonema sp. HK-05]|uniref:DMT family transporter n=1 Tax=Scytonema sp. HK-05 TaxID=1137095 RepID=UPI001E3920A8|nr:DMT family transporter [Scytonema sp. HK-05]
MEKVELSPTLRKDWDDRATKLKKIKTYNMVNQQELSQNTTKDNSLSSGFFSLLLGAFILSFAAIFTRLSENELGPAATSFNRFYIATIALFMWEGIQYGIGNSSKPTEVIKLEDWGIFLLSSILGTTASFFWACSLTQTSVANSNLLHNLTPIFATLCGWLFFRQSFDYKFLLGMGLAIIGAATISFGDFQEAVDSLVGDCLALLSAVFYALNYLVREHLRSKFSVTTILVWYCLFCGCFTFLLTLTTERQLFPTSWQTWLAVICLGVLCQIIGQGLLIHNLKQFSSGFVTLFMLLEPLLTALFAWVIFAQKLTPLNWVGFFLVLAGIYLAKLSKGSEKLADDKC